MYIGIDVGGTHTDAVLCNAKGVHAMVKVKTQPHAIACSIREALELLQGDAGLQAVQRITVSTTLGLNAMVQGKASEVGLFYTAGPGMDPQRFLQNSVMGRFAHRVEGGLDHRGCEVTPLNLKSIPSMVHAWQKQGVKHFAVAGKFSVRNEEHEKRIARALQDLGIDAAHITLAHTLSGQLSFPRRMAAAYVNASIQDVQRDFLHAVQHMVREFSIQAPVYLLKADGGAIPLSSALAQPIHTVLSGPAASVMGAMALGEASLKEAQDAVLIDMGGTTTDIALYATGLPVLDAQGMTLHMPCAGKSTPHAMEKKSAHPHVEMVHTPLRALATLSLALGGDSPFTVDIPTQSIVLSPHRQGAAMAFGGEVPTLVDALMVLAAQGAYAEQEGLQKAQQAMQRESSLCAAFDTAEQLAQAVVQVACEQILQGIQSVLQRLEGEPVYTLAQLLKEHKLRPQSVCLVGGPAPLLGPWLAPLLQKHLGVRLFVPKHSACANALGAALTLPTAHVEFFADTLQGQWRIPTLDKQGTLPRGFTLENAITMTQEALQESSAALGREADCIDVVEAESFAILHSSGRGGKDMRVLCQWRPGIVAALQRYWE